MGRHLPTGQWPLPLASEACVVAMRVQDSWLRNPSKGTLNPFGKTTIVQDCLITAG